MGITFPINLNDRFRVELTEYGLEVFRKHYRKRKTTMPDLEGPKKNEYHSELWDIMRIFGPAMQIGMFEIFKNNNMKPDPPL